MSPALELLLNFHCVALLYCINSIQQMMSLFFRGAKISEFRDA